MGRGIMRAALAAASFLAFTAGISAQSITVPNGLTVGASIQVSYSNTGLANQSVTITIDNGSIINPQSQQVTIQLNADGNGSVNWTVPNWTGAKFNGGGAPEVTSFIG